MRNIELKVRHPRLDAARAAVATLGAQHTWTRTQRDTYFLVPGARLKVREMPESAEVIFYRRADGTSPRPSEYEIVPVRDARAACAVLAAVCPPGPVVEKMRELWLWRDVRIHLDTVAALGTFVELEGVIRPPDDDATMHARVDAVIAALELSGEEAVPVSYCDLLGAQAVRRRYNAMSP